MASPEKREIIRAIHSILWEEWDPIGVKSISPYDDEYDSYIPRIHDLLRHGADHYKLTEHLYQIETVAMGLKGNRPHDSAIATRLLSLLMNDCEPGT